MIEDDPHIRASLRRTWGFEGYRVREAADGIGALTSVAEERPQLVILDLMLPGMDGIELCRRLSRRTMPSRPSATPPWRSVAPCSQLRRATRRPSAVAVSCTYRPPLTIACTGPLQLLIVDSFSRKPRPIRRGPRPPRRRWRGRARRLRGCGSALRPVDRKARRLAWPPPRSAPAVTQVFKPCRRPRAGAEGSSCRRVGVAAAAPLLSSVRTPFAKRQHV